MAGTGRSFGPLTVVAMLAAAGLGIWSAERAAEALGIGGAPGAANRPAPSASTPRRATDRPGPRSSAPVRHVPAHALTFGGASEAGIQLKGGSPGDAATGDPMPAGQDAAVPEAARSAATGLLDGLARVLRDLEWSPGLPEPKQQTIIPPPDPWRPPPGAESAPTPAIEGIEPGSGPAAGGAQVTIRGAHLRPASVIFGRAPAQIVSASPGAIVVVTPGGPAGAVDVAITNEDGTFAIADGRFTYAAPPAAPAR